MTKLIARILLDGNLLQKVQEYEFALSPEQRERLPRAPSITDWSRTHQALLAHVAYKIMGRPDRAAQQQTLRILAGFAVAQRQAGTPPPHIF